MVFFKRCVISIIFLVAVLATGTSAYAGIFGDDEAENLRSKNSSLNAQIATQNSQIEELKGRIASLQAEAGELRDKISRMVAEKTTMESQIAECQEKLAIESKRGTGIKVIFFGGDIIYEVASDAFIDYRAGLRYRSLTDQEFYKNMQNFEQGKGGDYEVLSVIKEIDKSQDRFIDLAEATAFRKSEEAR